MSEWIRTDKEMPPLIHEHHDVFENEPEDSVDRYWNYAESDPVLLSLKDEDGEYVVMGVYHVNTDSGEEVIWGWNGDTEGWEIRKQDIVAWMPSPEPYKAK